MNENKIKEAFASVLRAERARRKISQLALSLDSQIDKKFISYLESSKSQPTLTTMIKISEALNMKFSDFALEIEKELYKK